MTSLAVKHPSGMTPDRLADLFRKVSEFPITPEMIAADVANGAPVNADGSLSFVRYVAWLIAEDANARRS